MRPHFGAITGILKTQSKQNLSTPIYGMPGFFGMEVSIQIYLRQDKPGTSGKEEINSLKFVIVTQWV
jgi:hypothetical protein